MTASSSALEVPGNLHARAAKPEPTTPGTLEVEPCEANETEEVVAVETEEEGELSEERLRELYDDEEIERFLRLFSSVSKSTPSITVQSLTSLYMCAVCPRG